MLDFVMAEFLDYWGELRASHTKFGSWINRSLKSQNRKKIEKVEKPKTRKISTGHITSSKQYQLRKIHATRIQSTTSDINQANSVSTTMLVYASCTTNSSVHESVISCTSPFSSRDASSGTSDVIEKCNKPSSKHNNKQKQQQQKINNTANLHKVQVQQQTQNNNSQKLKSKLQVMSNKVSKNSQDEGYNSEETNRNNSRSTNSRPTSRESSNSAPDINRSDKRYNSLRQAQKQAIQQVQKKLKNTNNNTNHYYENHSLLRNTNSNPPPSNAHYQNIKANVQLSVIHQNINSTVYKTTYNKHDCILKKISNTDSAQYELLQTKYLHKIMPEYTLPVYKTSHTKQHVFMLMPEYGVSLYDFMTGRGAALREFEIKQIYKKVGLALYKLHETAGLSHLDIKEENILIDPDTLHPVLIDFATCRISVPPVHCQKIHTKMVGSPYFCAPEVVGCRASKSRDSQKAGNSSGKAGLSGNNGFSAVNDQFSRLGFEDNNELRNIRVKDYSKCDIYSFGVALFSSFTGDYPKLPGQKRPSDMSKDLWNIVAACLFAKKPKHRPSIRQILEAPFFNEK